MLNKFVIYYYWTTVRSLAPVYSSTISTVFSLVVGLHLWSCALEMLLFLGAKIIPQNHSGKRKKPLLWNRRQEIIRILCVIQGAPSGCFPGAQSRLEGDKWLAITGRVSFIATTLEKDFFLGFKKCYSIQSIFIYIYIFWQSIFDVCTLQGLYFCTQGEEKQTKLIPSINTFSFLFDLKKNNKHASKILSKTLKIRIIQEWWWIQCLWSFGIKGCF